MDTITHVSEESSQRAMSATEQVIADIWARELSVDALAVESDFFALGGDSLKMLTVLFRVTQALGVEVAPETLYVHPTLAAFSGAVEELLGGSAVASEMETGTL